MGIVVLATILNLDDDITFAMVISPVNTVVLMDDGHRRARTQRHQPAWAVTVSATRREKHRRMVERDRGLGSVAR
ncbi:MAG TPA: hypothetical protein VI299_30245 [Polyangiales bacterium]